MFAKPFRVKSNTQLKGSDKKKLKLEIRKRFPAFFFAPGESKIYLPLFFYQK
jgi:hypothetical protein